ncbi:MAG: thiazole biosynthesis adenylyltransferase ThiF [Candidatus Cloacimonadota bacterium]|nr:MAG: thiazole biosynthesis adenylyltransferase ThiF [Candidatus Cloacimonadota bacterium]
MIVRFSRQVLVEWIGKRGQKRLGEKSCLIIGCGALGASSATILVRAGIGDLRIVDRDIVEISDLSRNMLFDETDVTKIMPKPLAAKKKLERINSEVNIESFEDDVNSGNIEKYARGVDIILDGTDNLETRFLINDLSLAEKIPYVFGACVSSQGMVMNIIPGKSPCLRCFIEEVPQYGSLATCETAGILPSIPIVVGAIQANEAIKILINNKRVEKRLIFIDIERNEFSKLRVDRKERCPACRGEYEYLMKRKGTDATILCGRETVQISPVKKMHISLGELAKRLALRGEIVVGKHLIKFAPNKKNEIIFFRDGRALIKGTGDKKFARSLYSKYIGN